VCLWFWLRFVFPSSVLVVQATARGFLDRKRMRPEMEALAQRRAELAERRAEARDDVVVQWDAASVEMDEDARLAAMEETIAKACSNVLFSPLFFFTRGTTCEPPPPPHEL
jgi:hypothetical protein